MADSAQQISFDLIGDDDPNAKGVWPAQWIKAAIDRGTIKGEEPILAEQVQPASLDLRLGSSAYRVPASFLPGPGKTVQERLDSLCGAGDRINLDDGAILRKGEVYLIRLQEHIRLRYRESGMANPKSSTGRLDVFARLITDGGIEFDTIPGKYEGPLWLEVAPRSFNVMVRRGSRLAQVRVKSGSPRSGDAPVKRLYEEERIVDNLILKDGAVALTVDVHGDEATGLIGYKARETDAHIDLDKVDYYDPDDFWEKVYRPETGGIILHISDFYILATKDHVAVPYNYAADMVAYDTLVGEFRVHYAGFFDPGFGYTERGATGTRIVLEVRSHEVPFMIEDGQIVGKVVYEKLTAPTDKPYGAGIGSSYQAQGLTLGKQFKR